MNLELTGSTLVTTQDVSAKPHFTNTVRVSALDTFADIPMAKASHLTKSIIDLGAWGEAGEAYSIETGGEEGIFAK